MAPASCASVAPAALLGRDVDKQLLTDCRNPLHIERAHILAVVCSEAPLTLSLRMLPGECEYRLRTSPLPESERQRKTAARTLASSQVVLLL